MSKYVFFCDTHNALMRGRRMPEKCYRWRAGFDPCEIKRLPQEAPGDIVPPDALQSESPQELVSSN